MSLDDKEIEERLTAAGNTLLLKRPSLHDELLPLLDQIEELLQKVEQSPSRSMQTAISPLMKTLVEKELLKHYDVDVKVGVASCITEITRITAPDAPYDDDIMKDVFQLIVSSFENLSDTSSRSYDKRITILETVAKVRSCVIMLDLECDTMIIEMFHHFLKSISVNHAEVVFGSMETIMTLVLEESEDICPDLLIPILDTLKMNNEDVMPIAKKLAERVIQNSADRVRPYLAQTVKKLDADLDGLGKVVASVCQENTDIVGNSNESISRDQPIVERKSTSASPTRDQVTKVAKDGTEETNFQKNDSTLIGSSKLIVSNDIIEAGAGEIMTGANSRKADSNDQVDAISVFKIDSDECSAQNPVKLEAKAGNSEAEEVACNHEITGKDILISPTKAKPVEAAESVDKVEDTTSQLSPSQAPENEAANVASSTQSGSLCDVSPSKKDSSVKEENLDREETLSVDTVSKKASERESIPKSKLLHKGKMRSVETTAKDQTSTEDGASKNDKDSTSDLEARSLNQTKDLGVAVFKKPSEGESISKLKKLPQKGKKRSDETIDKDQSLSEEAESKNDEGSTSDSEARSLNQTKDLGDAVFKKTSEGESISKSKKLAQKGIKRSDKTTDKDQALTEEGASKNDDCSTSDSEARSLNQNENLDAASKKAPVGESISKSKKLAQKGINRSDKTTDKDQALTEESASKNDDCSTSDSEARSLNQKEKLDAASKKTPVGESSSKAKKQRQKGKRQTDETTDEDQTLTEESASKNDEGSTSDSEARSLNQTKKLGVAASKKASEGECISKAKKQRQKGKKQCDEITDQDTILTEEDASKNDEGSTTDSEERSRDTMEKLEDITSKKASKGGSISIVKKQLKKGKKRSAQKTDKNRALTQEDASKNYESGTSDSEARLLDQMEKLGGASNKMEEGSSMTKENIKMSGRLKPKLGKDALKSSAIEVHVKDKVTSPRSPLKSLKDGDIIEQTPKTSSKRKLTPGTEKASDTIEYGENLVGSNVKVWWPKDRMFYEGVIASFDSGKKKHKVSYNDGEEEVLNLKRERWEFVGADSVSYGDADVEHSSHDTSSDAQRKKMKVNTNSESSKSSKRQKMYGSPKSKPKHSTTKSGGKSKDDGKPESEVKVNNSKPSRNSVDDAAIKPRGHPRKLGGKSQGDSGKASSGNRSKDNSAKTPSHPTKQDSQRSTAKSNGKTPTKSSSSSKMKESGNPPTKTSTSSKVKETDRKKEKLADLSKSSTADTAKSRESESKSGKKRKR